MPNRFLKAGFVSVIFVAENTGSHGLCSPASPYLHSYRRVRTTTPNGSLTVSIVWRNVPQTITGLYIHPFSLKNEIS